MRAAVDKVRGTRRAGLALSAGLVVAGIWFLLPRALSPGEVDLVRAEAPRASAMPALVLAEAPRIDEPSFPSQARTPAALVEDPGATRHVAPQESRESTGRIFVRAADALTRESLDRLRVRALGEGRMADRESGASRFELELVLTPGSYSLLVLAPGYEPVELPPVRVAAGATVELPIVAMRSGSARILGTVGRTLQSDESLLVELMGKGRRPCRQCSGRFELRSFGSNSGSGHRDEPCPRCGFAPDRSRLPVGPAGDFAFDALASGSYALRLIDGRGHDVGEPVSVELRESDCARVAMDAPLLRTLRVEVIDTDGSSLADAWGAHVRQRRAALDAPDAPAERFVEKLDWRYEFHTGASDVRTGVFSTPTAAWASTSRPGAFGGRKLGTGPRRMPHDRALRHGEVLRPEPDVPRFVASPIEGRVNEDGLVVFEGVPAHELVLVLLCKGFTATVDVSPSSEDTRVAAQLQAIRADDTIPGTFRTLDDARYR